MSIRVGLRSMGRALGKVIIIDEWRKAANIFSTYSLCSSIPFWMKAANIFSTYNLCSSIPIEELTVTPTTGVSLCTLDGEVLTPILASVYDLSTAPT